MWNFKKFHKSKISLITFSNQTKKRTFKYINNVCTSSLLLDIDLEFRKSGKAKRKKTKKSILYVNVRKELLHKWLNNILYVYIYGSVHLR